LTHGWTPWWRLMECRRRSAWSRSDVDDPAVSSIQLAGAFLIGGRWCSLRHHGRGRHSPIGRRGRRVQNDGRRWRLRYTVAGTLTVNSNFILSANFHSIHHFNIVNYGTLGLLYIAYARVSVQTQAFIWNAVAGGVTGDEGPGRWGWKSPARSSGSPDLGLRAMHPEAISRVWYYDYADHISVQFCFLLFTFSQNTMVCVLVQHQGCYLKSGALLFIIYYEIVHYTRYTIRIKGKSKILSIQRPNNIKFWTFAP